MILSVLIFSSNPPQIITLHQRQHHVIPGFCVGPNQKCPRGFWRMGGQEYLKEESKCHHCCHLLHPDHPSCVHKAKINQRSKRKTDERGWRKRKSKIKEKSQIKFNRSVKRRLSHFLSLSFFQSFLWSESLNITSLVPHLVILLSSSV